MPLQPGGTIDPPASDVQDGMLFGESIALSSDGNWLAVGAPYDAVSRRLIVISSENVNVMTSTQQGSADGLIDWDSPPSNQPSRPTTLQPQNPTPQHLSAHNLSPPQPSCPQNAESPTTPGDVFVYRREGSTGGFTLHQVIRGASLGLENGARFGASVSIDAGGASLVVGCPYCAPGSLERAGAVYWFARRPVTLGEEWTVFEQVVGDFSSINSQGYLTELGGPRAGHEFGGIVKIEAYSGSMVRVDERSFLLGRFVLVLRYMAYGLHHVPLISHVRWRMRL